jgi:hypothetical protein
MKYIKCFLCILLLCRFCITIQSQSTIPATGGNSAGTGGSVSYTVGQITYITIPGTNGIVVQGVQQPYEISVVTALDDAIGINLICSVFPNPTNNFLILKVGDYESSKLSYQLYGVSGNLIETKKILDNETRISMENKVSGSYFLKITSGNKEIKTFKIIKN